MRWLSVEAGVDDRQWPQVGAWLRRHQAGDLAVTPLVAARVSALVRVSRIERRIQLALLAIVAIVVVVAAAGLGSWAEPGPGTTGTLVGFAAALVVLNAVLTGVMFWLRWRADRRLAAGTGQRTGQPATLGLTAIMTRSNLRLLAVVYGGAVLTGAVCAGLVSTPDDRSLAIAFAGCAILCAGLCGGLLLYVVQRPGVVEDEASLRADELLRRVDADRALFPYPLVLAGVAITVAVGSPLLWVFVGYAAAALAVWSFTARPARAAVEPA